MIEKMTKYSFILPASSKESFLEELQTLGVVDISHSEKPVDDRSNRLFEKIEELKSLYSDIQKGSDRTLEGLLAAGRECEKNLSEVKVWGSYDREKLSVFGLHYYIVSEKKFDPSWEQEFPLQKVLSADGNVWFVVLGDVSGFPLKEIPAPSCTEDEAQLALSRKEDEINAYRKALEARRDELPQLQQEIASLSEELNRYLASLKGESAAEGALVVFEAFAPESEKSHLKQKFDTMDCVWMEEPAKAEDAPPIKLRNNWFARQFEVLTGMYGMPVYDEFDPTPILAPFFLLFFALCMGDAGYGLLLITIGLLLKGKSGGLAKLWKLIILLGAGTTVIGLLLGTFLGISLSDAAWYPAALKRFIISGTVDLMDNSLDLQMVMAVCIGILHICLAMCVKAVLFTRRFGFKSNINTWGWTLLITGSVLVATLGLLGVCAPDLAKWIIIGIGSVSALGIFIFNKPGRNPLINIGAGLWDTYGMATGLLGDVLSYIRLYALGLAGGILGSTFNTLGNMVLGDNPTWQWPLFALLVIFGHALNLAMSCLGAFVHPLRLTFVEYFKNSGYEGAGRLYSPLSKTTNQNL